MLLCNVAFAADVSAVTVSTYQELKKALETTTGSNITLGANIVVPSSLRSDTAIVITGGYSHTEPEWIFNHIYLRE